MPFGLAPSSTTWADRLIGALDQGLRALAAPQAATRPSPAAGVLDSELTADERRQSAALMRVNHAGEIAAQALYAGQALLARDETTRNLLETAAREVRGQLRSRHASRHSQRRHEPRIRERNGAPSRSTPARSLTAVTGPGSEELSNPSADGRRRSTSRHDGQDRWRRPAAGAHSPLHELGWRSVTAGCVARVTVVTHPKSSRFPCDCCHISSHFSLAWSKGID